MNFDADPLVATRTQGKIGKSPLTFCLSRRARDLAKREIDPSLFEPELQLTARDFRRLMSPEMFLAPVNRLRRSGGGDEKVRGDAEGDVGSTGSTRSCATTVTAVRMCVCRFRIDEPPGSLVAYVPD